MAGSLAQILTGAGLAGASGHRAFLPPLLLGAAHRAGWFDLSPKFQWLADPRVMAILGALALVEFLAERNPDAPELVNLALKLPKAVAGFVCASAAVGRVDENVVLLATSGLLGSGVSLGVDKLRADVKHAVQQPLSDATHGASDKAMGWLESAWSGFLTVMAWVVPILAIAGICVLAAVWFARRRAADARRVPCPRCGHRCPPGARVCSACRSDIAPAAPSAPTAAPPAEPPTV